MIHQRQKHNISFMQRHLNNLIELKNFNLLDKNVLKYSKKLDKVLVKYLEIINNIKTS